MSVLTPPDETPQDESAAPAASSRALEDVPIGDFPQQIGWRKKVGGELAAAASRGPQAFAAELRRTPAVRELGDLKSLPPTCDREFRELLGLVGAGRLSRDLLDRLGAAADRIAIGMEVQAADLAAATTLLAASRNRLDDATLLKLFRAVVLQNRRFLAKDRDDASLFGEVEVPLRGALVLRAIRGMPGVRKAALKRLADQLAEHQGAPEPISDFEATCLQRLRLLVPKAIAKSIDRALRHRTRVLATAGQADSDTRSSLDERRQLFLANVRRKNGQVHLLADYRGQDPVIRLATVGGVLQNWLVDVVVDGQPLTPSGWRNECWFSDRDADYLELQSQVEGQSHVRLTRQIAIDKKRSWVLLAASVRGREDGTITISHRFAAAYGTDWEIDPRDRLVWMRFDDSDRLEARLVPLGLRPDRLVKELGDLSIDRTSDEQPAAVVVTERSSGSGLCSPVAFEVSPKRHIAPIDWQRLTVAEFGHPCPPDRAVGWRMRSGGEQWAIYQSLTPPTAPRTMLGMHTHYEAVIGRVTAGGIEPLVNVESPE